jgi:hypothetical protein
VDLRSRFHLGTWNAPTAWGCSTVDSGSHSCGRGLKVSFRARVDASEALRDRRSVVTVVNVSMDETRFNDMAAVFRYSS